MKSIRFFVISLFFIFLTPLLAYAGVTSDLITVTFDKGKKIENQRKHFSDGKNIRYEEETKSEGRVIEIFNYDTKKKYTVMDALKIYIVQDMPKEEELSSINDIIEGKDKDEIKSDKDGKKPKDKDKKPKTRTVEKKLLKEEVYEGYSCAIYDIKIIIIGRVNQSTVCVIKELNNFIAKSENISYLGIKSIIEHKNIKKVDIEPSFFLPPKDYKSMSPF
ncbi:MAG: hypothetical protein HZA05_04955 [Nitrospirae bacterium]|nr:hypothetical protein [Nitrospirota bacterium]